MGFLSHFILLGLTALLRHIVLCCINPVTLPSPNRQLPLGNCNQALLSTQLALSTARKSQQLSWKLVRGDGRSDTHAPGRRVPGSPRRQGSSFPGRREGSSACCRERAGWATKTSARRGNVCADPSTAQEPPVGSAPFGRQRCPTGDA